MPANPPIKVGIVIDAWKLPIFVRYLTNAGIDFKKDEGLSRDTVSLVIDKTDAALVERVARSANREAAATKRGSTYDN